WRVFSHISVGVCWQTEIILPVAAMGQNNEDIPALEVLSADPAEDVIQAPYPTAHEWSQHRLGLLIKRFSQYLRHGEDDMPVDDAFMEHLAHLTDPVVHIDFRAA